MKSLLEVIKQSNKALLSQLQKGDKSYMQGTFGIEIEVAVRVESKNSAAPDIEEVVKWLATSKEEDALRWKQSAINDTGYDNPIPALFHFLHNNKNYEQMAIDTYVHFNSDKFYSFRKSQEIIDDIKDIVYRNKFEVNDASGDASGEMWGVGYDAKAGNSPLVKDEDETLVEMRSGILKVNELSDVLSLLEDLDAFIDHNSDYVRVHGGTSAHVHVSNPHIRQGEDKDYFTSLATALHLDEEGVMGAAGTDREFDAYAKNVRTLFQTITEFLGSELFKKTYGTTYLSNEQLGQMIKSIPDVKHHGVNVSARYPTVEFRYLSSQVLSNPKKFVEWIKYYLTLPTAAAGKQQIRLWENPERNSGSTIVLTRAPGNRIRVDYQYERKNVPQAGVPTQDLKKPAARLQTGIPFAQWFKSLNPKDQSREKAKLNTVVS